MEASLRHQRKHGNTLLALKRLNIGLYPGRGGFKVKLVAANLSMCNHFLRDVSQAAPTQSLCTRPYRLSVVNLYFGPMPAIPTHWSVPGGKISHMPATCTVLPPTVPFW